MNSPFRTGQNIYYSVLVGTAGLIYSVFLSTSDQLALAYNGNRIYAGYYVAAYAVGAFFGQIVWGWLADSIGKARVVRVAAGLLAVGLLIVFFSPHKLVIFLGVLLMGVGGSAVEAMSSALLTDHNPSTAARWVNLSQVCFCAGALGAPLLVVFVSSRQANPLWLFWMLAALLAVLAIPSPVRKHPGGTACATGGKGAGNPFRLLRNRRFGVICAMIFLYCGCETLAVTYLKQYFQYAGSSDALAALAVSVFWLFMILMRVASAIRNGDAVASIRMCGCVLLAGFAGLCLPVGPGLRFVAAAMIGLGCGPIWCQLFVLGGRQHPSSSSGAAFSVMALFASSACTVFPVAFGSWINHLRVTYLLCVVFVAGLLLCLWRFSRMSGEIVE